MFDQYWPLTIINHYQQQNSPPVRNDAQTEPVVPHGGPNCWNGELNGLVWFQDAKLGLATHRICKAPKS